MQLPCSDVQTKLAGLMKLLLRGLGKPFCTVALRSATQIGRCAYLIGYGSAELVQSSILCLDDSQLALQRGSLVGGQSCHG